MRVNSDRERRKGEKKWIVIKLLRKSEKMDVSKLLRKSAGKSYLQFTFFTNFT